VIVAVSAVRVVQMAIHQVINMVAMRHGFVAAVAIVNLNKILATLRRNRPFSLAALTGNVAPAAVAAVRVVVVVQAAEERPCWLTPAPALKIALPGKETPEEIQTSRVEQCSPSQCTPGKSRLPATR